MLDDQSTVEEKKDIAMQNGTEKPECPAHVEINESLNHLEINPTLKKIAETNKVGISWEQLQPILIDLLTKQNNLMEHKIKDESLKKAVDDLFHKIVQSINEHLSCPFTIQRFCELIIDPQRYYKMYIKYLRAVEKILQVTSYWEDYVHDADSGIENDEDTTMDETTNTATSTTATAESATSNGSSLLFITAASDLKLEPHNFDMTEPEGEEEQEEASANSTSTANLVVPSNNEKEQDTEETEVNKADDLASNTEEVGKEKEKSDLEATDKAEAKESVAAGNSDERQVKVETDKVSTSEDFSNKEQADNMELD